MLTIENARMFLEHAPPARPHQPGAPVGWRLTSDGGTICDACASRIIGRGCDFSGVTPIYDTEWIRRIKCDTCEFKLANDPPVVRPQSFDNGEKTRQRVLVDGLNCLPGQLDLFD